jgi:hypothetical protein
MRDMKARRTAAVLTLAVCLWAARADAAVVTLKDGSVLRGKIAAQTADGLELATPDGTLRIGAGRIQRVDYAEEAPLVPLDLMPGAKPAPAGDRRQLLSLSVGLMQPVSRINFGSIGGGDAQNGDLGTQLTVQYVYLLTPNLGAGAEVGYLDRAGTLSARLFPAARASVEGSSWVMLGILRYSLPRLGRARPFVLAGAGGARNSMTVDVRPSVWADTATNETRRLIDDSVWTPAASARVGLDFDVDPFQPGVVTVEAGWTGLAAAHYGATPQGQKLGLSGVSAPLNLIAFSVRYGWRF